MHKQSLNIIYLTQVDITKHYSGAIHIKEVVNLLLLEGFNVTLLARKIGDFQKEHPGFTGIEVGEIIDNRAFSYLVYQLRLFVEALKILLRMKQKRTILYVRSEIAMISHIILHFLIRIPYFLELNCWPFRDIQNEMKVSILALWVIKQYIGLSIRNSRRIICVTDEIRKRLKDIYGINKGVYTLHNGANIKLFKPLQSQIVRKEIGLGETDFVIGFVSYFQYYNDVEIAVKAVSILREKIQNLKLLLVGAWAQQSHKKKIEGVISKTIEKNVVLVGEVPYERVNKYISAFDIAISTFSIDVGDGSVMKVQEYLACGKPVIASNISSLTFVEEIGAGKLIPIGDLKTFVETITALERSRLKLKRMGNKGREYVIQNYSWEIVVKRLIKIISS